MTWIYHIVVLHFFWRDVILALIRDIWLPVWPNWAAGAVVALVVNNRVKKHLAKHRAWELKWHQSHAAAIKKAGLDPSSLPPPTYPPLFPGAKT
jgi:hypothetical protein